jgi:hypothetical protein
MDQMQQHGVGALASSSAAIAGPEGKAATTEAGGIAMVSPAVFSCPVRPACKPSGDAQAHKLCVSCGERRSNVLLMPCKHVVLCDACADVDSCPICGEPCKQRIKVVNFWIVKTSRSLNFRGVMRALSSCMHV